MMESKFFGKDILSRPKCPFCGLDIDKPVDLSHSAMPMGRCGCGAVYAFDVTGHNLGSAMIEALVYACGGDCDCAWSLISDEDYVDEQVYNYDDQTHRIVQSGTYEGRRIAGTLYFIRLVKELPGSKEQSEVAERSSLVPSSSELPAKKSFAKHDVEAFVKAYELDILLAMAREDKRIIRDLKRLLYSADDLVRRRAAEALGMISGVIAERDPATVAKLMQGLFSSLMDTAASSWGALDAIGEIICRNPRQFSGYIPQLYPMVRDKSLLPDILRALGKISLTHPEPIQKVGPHFIPFLNDPVPTVRAYAAMLLGRLGTEETGELLSKLLEDPAEVSLYEGGNIMATTVGRVCADALKGLKELSEKGLRTAGSGSRVAEGE
jgi:hypothetical protein